MDASIPVIDVAPFIAGNAEVGRLLARACPDIGSSLSSATACPRTSVG
jgi:hypothetical protein